MQLPSIFHDLEEMGKHSIVGIALRLNGQILLFEHGGLSLVSLSVEFGDLKFVATFVVLKDTDDEIGAIGKDFELYNEILPNLVADFIQEKGEMGHSSIAQPVTYYSETGFLWFIEVSDDEICNITATEITE